MKRTITTLLLLFITITCFGQTDLLIEDIVCEGNRYTNCEFIKKKYYQDIGDKVDPDEIADAELRLGTLIQFRNVHFRLNKGSKRNVVQVVIQVTETNPIQYGVRFFAGSSEGKFQLDNIFYSIRQKSEATTEGITGSVANYNFLGRAKQISLTINTNHEKRRSEYSTIVFGQPNLSTQNKGTSSFDDQAISVQYYDPHFLSSRYLYTNLAVSRSRLDGRGLKDQYATNVSANIGRRFGSTSFAQIEINKPLRDSDVHSIQYGVRAGWDSRDDLLFPTQGSVFNASLNLHHSEGPKLSVSGTNSSTYVGTRTNNLYSTTLSYTKHITFDGINVFNAGVGADYAAEGSPHGDTIIKSGNISFGYSRFRNINATEGAYSGWKFNVGAAYAPEFLDLTRKSSFVALDFVRQTDRFVLQFGLTYNDEQIGAD